MDFKPSGRPLVSILFSRRWVTTFKDWKVCLQYVISSTLAYFPEGGLKLLSYAIIPFHFMPTWKTQGRLLENVLCSGIHLRFDCCWLLKKHYFYELLCRMWWHEKCENRRFSAAKCQILDFWASLKFSEQSLLTVSWTK